MFQANSDKMRQKQLRKIEQIKVDEDNALFFITKRLEDMSSDDESSHSLAIELERLNRRLDDRRYARRDTD